MIIEYFYYDNGLKLKISFMLANAIIDNKKGGYHGILKTAMINYSYYFYEQLDAKFTK